MKRELREREEKAKMKERMGEEKNKETDTEIRRAVGHCPMTQKLSSQVVFYHGGAGRREKDKVGENMRKE